MPRVSKEVQGNVLLHPTHFKLIYSLLDKPNNALGLQNIGLGSNSILGVHLKKLYSKEYLIIDDKLSNNRTTFYQVNYNKLIEEFIKHCNNKHIWVLDETLYFNNMLNKCIISKKFKTLKEVFEFIDNYLYYKNKMQEFLKK